MSAGGCRYGSSCNLQSISRLLAPARARVAMRGTREVSLRTLRVPRKARRLASRKSRTLLLAPCRRSQRPELTLTRTCIVKLRLPKSSLLSSRSHRSRPVHCVPRLTEHLKPKCLLEMLLGSWILGLHRVFGLSLRGKNQGVAGCHFG